MRRYILLTGDKALRNAAVKEMVEVHGTLWIYKELIENGKITVSELLECLEKLQKINGTVVRLPAVELERMIIKYKESCK